jgi:sugar lactone lactonase YvrE
MMEPVCVVPAGDWTGEGALWHAAERTLYWVDINRFLIHRYDPATRAVHTWFFPEPPTAIGLTDRADTLIVSLASRLVLWQPGNDARADFAFPHRDWPNVRFNDARPDPAGNFWAGTMQNNVAADGGDIPITDHTLGSLFRVTGKGTSTIEKTGIGIANTFCWSPDATRFYCGDTLANVISVWDYDRATGRIANERPFFSGYDRGGPDGSAVDSAGYLWNARYGGGCIVRVAPDGRIDRVIEMPAAAVTTCTFGGPSLTTLYITTARGGLGQANHERFAGGLFTLEVEVPGLPENVVRLNV